MGDERADAVIIGGGFTGLSAAHHLAALGMDAIVLERAVPGWGASGRNGGMLVPRPKSNYTNIANAYGEAEALRQRLLQREAVETVETLIAAHAIPCHYERAGYIAAAHSEDADAILDNEAAWLRGPAGDSAVRRLSAAEVREELGGGTYVGGYLDPLGGRVQPLAYARGLAAGLKLSGLKLYARSEVTAVEHDANGVTVHTAGGSVKAGHLIVATNGYTPPGLGLGTLHRRIIPVSSSAIATAPLPGNEIGRYLPGGRAMSDTKRLLNWVRISPDNRVVFGGRGDITGRRDDAQSYRGIEAALHGLFPDLQEVPITHRWSGMVAVPREKWPHLGSLSGRVHFAMGYGGRGVAMASLLGRYLGRRVAGEQDDLGPITAGPFRPFALHRFRVPGMRAAAAWYGLRDRIGL
jgi:glycine/D-amino acid oxidase-like deaminating enzyme